MTRSRGALICLMSGALLAQPLSMFADAKPNKYDTIPERNIFKLRPLPPPVPENPTPVEPPSKVTLTGITDILGAAMALMEVQPQGKPKMFMTLSEGQREGDISVVSINQKVGTVTIKNQNVTQTLDMGDATKRAGSSVAAMPVITSANPMMRPAIPTPGVPAPVANENAGGDFRSRVIQSRRDMRVTTSGDGTGASGVGGTATGVKAQSSGLTAHGMTPEEQVIRMEVSREMNKGKDMPPLPPTELTPPMPQ